MVKNQDEWQTIVVSVKSKRTHGLITIADIDVNNDDYDVREILDTVVDYLKDFGYKKKLDKQK